MTSNGYMQGNGDGTFNPDAPMTRAEFCAMFNNVTGREDYDLVDADGNKVVPETYYIVDLDGAANWQVRAMMLGTSAFNKDYTVDVDTRIANIRNILDNYDSQKKY
ncbi:MAG: S-layer homology domain-containing protein [Clostridia bacterium]|nr:S-layer homology domain-containing protein [Clostridia bacterium]